MPPEVPHVAAVEGGSGAKISHATTYVLSDTAANVIFGSAGVLLGFSLFALVIASRGTLPNWLRWTTMVVAVMAVGAPAFFPSFAIPLWALVVGVRLLLVGRFPLACRGSMAGPRQRRQQTIGQPRWWPARHTGQQSGVTLSGRPARKISVALCQGPTTLLARRRCLRGARPRVGADAALVGVCRAWARGFTCAEREVAGGVVDRSLDHGRGQPYRFLVSELLFPHE